MQTELGDVLRRNGQALLAVGSGGSFTAAAYAAFLHEEVCGGVARPATPLDCVNTAQKLTDFSALLISAGGRNRDALQACQAFIDAEPDSFSVLCASPRSPLAKLAHEAGAKCIVVAPPSGKDGFLATNSLLAFCTLLCRAYCPSEPLAASIEEMLGSSLEDYAKDLSRVSRAVLARETILVLHGQATRAVAIDLESKFSEAALGSIHVSDFRNFGHGRHHWLAKRASSTGVIALVHGDDDALATKTLNPLPASVPRCKIEICGTRHTATLGGLVAAFFLTQLAGKARGIDPGRPSVPRFGSKLYSVKMPALRRTTRIDAAARRKMRVAHIETVEAWRERAERALARIEAARFRGVVVDYDGTICSQEDRLAGLRTETATALVRLIREGMMLAIATGRGQSVTKELRKAFPEDAWPHVVVGYYNGGHITRLDEGIPASVKDVAPALTSILERLRADARLMSLADLEARRPQIQVKPHDAKNAELIWSLVERHLIAVEEPRLCAVLSSHSLDILAPGVTKLAVVTELERICGGVALRVGDRGRHPGNDFALLDSAIGLSVDEVSPSEDRCWNFTSPGARGSAGAIEYLDAIERDGTSFRFALKGAADIS